ncbi:hypothetical protein A2U01_0051289, partial [Trifolium medium]|nr:hypothetical protein [Trifolium medium]
MYQNLFTKLKHQITKLQPYKDGPLTAFDSATIQPLEFVTLHTTFGDNQNPSSLRTIQAKFLIIPCNSAYNCIMGRMALRSLGVVPSTVHLKMRYHGINDEVVTIYADSKASKQYLWTTGNNLLTMAHPSTEIPDVPVQDADFDPRLDEYVSDEEKKAEKPL